MLIVASLVCLAWVWHRRPHPLSHTAVFTSPIQQLLRPRTPDHCPACRQKGVTSTTRPSVPTLVTPWRECKSRRGAPKRIATQGFACPNRSCLYYQITDAHIHALVGDGAHGQYERIQTLRCQACGTMAHTPCYPALPPQDHLPPDCRSAHRPGGSPLRLSRRAPLWASACHHHQMADTCRPTQCDLARPPLPAAAPATHSV